MKSAEECTNYIREMETSFSHGNGYSPDGSESRTTGRTQTTTIGRLWHNWADNTTLHGIKFIFAEDVAIRRTYWAVVFLLFVGYLSYLAITQTQRFYEYKTVTRTSIIMEEKPLFPAVTICNFNLIQNGTLTDYMTKQLLKVMYLDDQWNTDRQTISQIQQLNEDFLQNVSIRTLFLNGSPRLNEAVKKCVWIKDEIPCDAVMTLRKTEYGFCYTFGEKDIHENYTFSARTTGSKAGIQFMLWVNQSNYYVADEDTAGFKVIIHNRNEEPDLSQGLALSPGNSYYIGLSKEEVSTILTRDPINYEIMCNRNRLTMKIFLPHPVRAFGTRKCVDVEDAGFQSPLEYFDTYSIHACMWECRSKLTYRHCNCSGPFDAGNYTECRPLEILHCVREATQIFNTEYDVDICKCPLPCHVTKFNTKVSSAYFPNNNWYNIRYGASVSDVDKLRKDMKEEWLQVRIYFESLEMIRREQILMFTQEDLIASFGGFLGLFIGASLITLLEILELIVISAFRCVRARRSV